MKFYIFTVLFITSCAGEYPIQYFEDGTETDAIDNDQAIEDSDSGEVVEYATTESDEDDTGEVEADSYVCDESDTKCLDNNTYKCVENEWVIWDECSKLSTVCETSSGMAYCRTDEVIDTDNDTETVSVSECIVGEKKCDNEIVYSCSNGEWKKWDDCYAMGKTCEDGSSECISSVDADADADSDTDADTDSDADSDSDSDSDTDTDADTESEDGLSKCEKTCMTMTECTAAGSVVVDDDYKLYKCDSSQHVCCDIVLDTEDTETYDDTEEDTEIVDTDVYGTDQYNNGVCPTMYISRLDWYCTPHMVNNICFYPVNDIETCEGVCDLVNGELVDDRISGDKNCGCHFQ